MDFEIYDHVLAWTLEAGDFILHDKHIYRIENSEPSKDFPAEKGFIFYDVEDEWGDSVTVKLCESDYIPLVQNPRY